MKVKPMVQVVFACRTREDLLDVKKTCGSHFRFPCCGYEDLHMPVYGPPCALITTGRLFVQKAPFVHIPRQQLLVAYAPTCFADLFCSASCVIVWLRAVQKQNLHRSCSHSLTVRGFVDHSKILLLHHPVKSWKQSQKG